MFQPTCEQLYSIYDTRIKIDDLIERAFAKHLLAKGLQVWIQPKLGKKRKADFIVKNGKNPRAKGTVVEITRSLASEARKNKYSRIGDDGQTNALIKFAGENDLNWAVFTRENLTHMGICPNPKSRKQQMHTAPKYPYLYNNLGLHLNIDHDIPNNHCLSPKGTRVQKILCSELLRSWTYNRQKVTNGNGLPVVRIAEVLQCDPRTVEYNINGYPNSPNTGMNCFETQTAIDVTGNTVPIITAKEGTPLDHCNGCYFKSRGLCVPQDILPPSPKR